VVDGIGLKIRILETRVMELLKDVNGLLGYVWHASSRVITRVDGLGCEITIAPVSVSVMISSQKSYLKIAGNCEPPIHDERRCIVR
jgi:hypothetical protein